MSDVPRKPPPTVLDHSADSFARPVLDDLRNREAKARVTPELRAALAPRYDVESEIGAGGMAVVYKAYDNNLKRHVAVKTLRPELADGITTDRFELEISVAARLDHPHIVPLHDRGANAGIMYFMMRLVVGESLRDRLEKRKQLDIPEAISIARHVAEALDYAHSQQVIHRDIKPENILLDENGAYLTDFGIARIQDVVGVERITRTGIAIGTAPYMSPEQIEAQAVDGRSDVYALTCVLYEMLAGEPPYTGRSSRDVLNKHMAAAIPDLSVVRSTVTSRMQQVIATGLQKAAADRFPSARQLVDSFERAFKSVSDAAVPATPRPRTLAVLPFANMSGDDANDYFSDGIADELIGALIRAGNLRVVARTSSFHFKGQQRDIREIGVALGATHLLEGSVRIAGKRLRATAQLVDAMSGHPLWSERFDRDLEDVFAVQDEITNAIANRLKQHLEPPAAPPAQAARKRAATAGSGAFVALMDPSMKPAPKRKPEDSVLERLVEATRGEYEIEGELGRGAVCTVYKARDLVLQRSVAIKTLIPDKAPVGSHRERLKREANVAARLDHPNIVSVYAVRERQDILFFVSRLVAGPTLRQILTQSGPFPLPAALFVLKQMASALTYAHLLSVLHHDLRPENAMVEDPGTVFLADFGIATAWEGEEHGGVVMGTPTYMSPERLQGTSVTAASDQYALGVIAYELLAGKPPFPGASPLDIIAKHMFETAPRLHEARRNIPRPVGDAIERMLAKDPKARFPDCNAATAALGEFDEEEGRVRLRQLMIELGYVAPSGVWAPPAAAPRPAAVPRSKPRVLPTAAGEAKGGLVGFFARFVDLFRPVPSTEPPPGLDDEEAVDFEGLMDVEFRRSRFEGGGDLVFADLEKTPETGQAEPQKRFPAYDEFLRGRFLLNFEATPGSIRRAIEHFDVAIAANESFAPAYAARAVAKTMFARTGAVASPFFRSGAEDAGKALALDPNLAEAHVAKALVATFFNWDRETALAALDNAIAKSSAYAEPHLWRGVVLNWLEGSPEPAIKSLNRAIDLDPLSLVTRVELAFAHLLKGDLDQALRDADEAVASGLMLGTKPRGDDRDKKPEAVGFAEAHYARGVVLTQLGRYDEAIREGREALRIGGRQTMHMALVGFAHAKRGDAESARGMIAKIESHGMDLGVRISTALATVHAGLGDNALALDALDSAVSGREVNAVLVPFSPLFAGLRNEPRFKELMAAVRP